MDGCVQTIKMTLRLINLMSSIKIQVGIPRSRILWLNWRSRHHPSLSALFGEPADDIVGCADRLSADLGYEILGKLLVEGDRLAGGQGL